MKAIYLLFSAFYGEDERGGGVDIKYKRVGERGKMARGVGLRKKGEIKWGVKTKKSRLASLL